MRNILKFLLCAMCCTMMFSNYGYSMNEMSDSEFVQNLENRLKSHYTVIVTQDEIDKYESVTGKKLIPDDKESKDDLQKNCSEKESTE